MRKTFFAAVALCPMLLQAQVISPAQPKSEVTNPVLVSGLSKPKTTGAFFEAAGGAIPDKTPMRVSTGITQPKLIEAPQVAETSAWHWSETEREKLVVVGMTVDSTGKPSDVHILRSLGPLMDRDVLASVSHYRFQPGTLNHEATAMPVELTIKIRSGE